MKKITAGLLLMTTLFFFLPRDVNAAERNDGMREVLRSSVYGGLTGALIGTAFLAFREKPSDHLKDIRVGAGIGIIIGTLYGLAKTTSLVEIKKGTVTVQMPSLRINVDQDTDSLRGSIDLLKIPF